ncbi:MAG: DNA-binding protein [Lysobacteraceae bacterium]
MARSGVTEEQVAHAADELLLAGERPTIERVRASLGTGSPNTLIRHLDAWWKRLGERLIENRRQIDLPDAPPQVSEAASTLWRLALAKAAEGATADLKAQRAALERQRLDLEEQRLQAEARVKKAEAHATNAALASERAQLRADGLDQLREQHVARINALEEEIARTREHSEKLLVEQKAASEQIKELLRSAKAERASAAEHIRSVEDRAHQEIDRARLETSRSAKRIAELEKQIQRQAAESAKRLDRLARDLREADIERVALRAKIASEKPAKAKRSTVKKSPQRLRARLHGSKVG